MSTRTEAEPLASYDAETAAALKLWVVLSRAYRSVAEHDRRDIERHGLSPTEFAVLEVLYHKGPLLLGEIGRRVLLTSGSITYVIDKLEERGLLERNPCTEDRRATWAKLTPEGHSIMSRVFPQHAAALREVMQGLTTEEQRIATVLLRRLGIYAQHHR